jgi:hypothetical protein
LVPRVRPDTQLVGDRQASKFKTLAALAGHGQLPARATTTKKAASNGAAPAKTPAANKRAATKKTTRTPIADERDSNGVGNGGDKGKAKIKDGQDVGLSVRIEVNLPPGGDADTYDAIFASIKKHLMS